MYLHWSLPKMYQQGMSTTPSAQAVHKKEVLRHGYKAAAVAANANAGVGPSSFFPDGQASPRSVDRRSPCRECEVFVSDTIVWTIEKGSF